MTPAEQLAAKKPMPRASKRVPRKTVWRCLVRSERERLRLSMRDVAKAVKLSVTAVFQIEHGGDVTLTSADRIARFFGKRIDELWLRKAAG